MNEHNTSIEKELQSIGRKSDQSCSIHAWLRDRYQLKATLLDYCSIAGALYLLGLSLVEPAIGIPLSFGMDRQMLLALFSIVIFFLSVVQFKSDWKTKAESHSRAMKEYAEIKSACRAITSGTRPATAVEHDQIKARYDAVTDIGTDIPHNAFVRGKAQHLRKLFVSRYLDDHPGARPWIVHAKLYLRDNLGIDLLTDGPKDV